MLTHINIDSFFLKVSSEFIIIYNTFSRWICICARCANARGEKEWCATTSLCSSSLGRSRRSSPTILILGRRTRTKSQCCNIFNWWKFSSFNNLYFVNNGFHSRKKIKDEKSVISTCKDILVWLNIYLNLIY